MSGAFGGGVVIIVGVGVTCLLVILLFKKKTRAKPDGMYACIITVFLCCCSCYQFITRHLNIKIHCKVGYIVSYIIIIMLLLPQIRK